MKSCQLPVASCQRRWRVPIAFCLLPSAFCLLFLSGCPRQGDGTGSGGVVVDNRGNVVKAPAPRADGLVLRLPPADPELPALSAVEARALFRLIRSDALRKMSGELSRRTLMEFSDLELPESLFAQNGSYVIVSLYPGGGAEPRFGFAAAGTLGFSAAAAAYAALGDGAPALLKTARIKIDLASSITPCGLDARLVPGVEGLIVANKGLALLPPDQFLGDRPNMKDYLRKLVKRAGLPEGFEEKKTELMLAKFATTSVLQLSEGAEPAFLYRGNALVEPPTVKACLQGARRGVAWLAGVQRKDGGFPVSCGPYADRCSEDRCSALAQATSAIAVFISERQQAMHPGLPDVVVRYYRTLFEGPVRPLMKDLVQDPRFRFAYVSDPDTDGAVSLGASAMTLIAMEEGAVSVLGRGNGAQEGDYKAMRSLAEFILQQQAANGSFLSHFDPVQGRPVKKLAEVNYPGQAILALVRLYELDGKKDARLLDAAKKGAKHLLAVSSKQSAESGGQPLPAAHRPLPTDSWLMQALDALTTIEPDAELSAHLLAQADSAMAGQLTPDKTRFPDLVGGMDEADPPGVAMTAARGEGLLAALRTAKRLGKTEEAGRIERALDLAALYVIENQWRPENAYALPAPEKAIGGFRASPLAGEMRPETTAHAALFLFEYAQLKAGGK